MASFSCPECNFTAQFESALMMHKQLHHGSSTGPDDGVHDIKKPKEKSFTIPRTSFDSLLSSKERIFKMPARTSSATKLLGKLRAKICKSKTLFIHEEEQGENNDLQATSECSTRALKSDSRMKSPVLESKETYSCHLCSFDADRITVLDRHLLNDHKLGLENLLKLVLTKTRTGLSIDEANLRSYVIRQPYYKTEDDIIEDGEFIIENVKPKIKVMKHASNNTDLKWFEIPDLDDNCRMISEELDRFMKDSGEKLKSEDFLSKMQTLNSYMCKFFDSSNTLKKALNKEFEVKGRRRDDANDLFDLKLGDQDTPREWSRSQGDQIERKRSGCEDKSRSEKTKLTADSFYFN